MTPQPKIAILGAGAWGTAVAVFLAKSGRMVSLWAKDKEQVARMQEDKCNARYLPDCIFPDNLHVNGDLHACVSQATIVIIAVPSHAFAALVGLLPQPQAGLAWLTKGLDPESQQVLSKLVSQRFGQDYPIAVIAGPSFAREVAADLPTALLVASKHPAWQSTLRDLLHVRQMRVYLSDDVLGVQLCGAVKNVLAIACGISDGIGYGANAEAALITRGLAEMQRLLHAYHAKTQTCLGLAGVGDLVLTCTDNQSRNRRFGVLLGQAIDPKSAAARIGQVIEGQHNAAQVCALATQHQIDMPICAAVNAVLSQEATPAEAVALLMNRPPQNEN